MESINVHVLNFVACPGAQVYWWLQQRGCLAEDVNQMVCHCFTLNQQQKITKSKYVSAKGYDILDKANSDDIINAVAGEGIYDMTLGLLDKERRMAIASKAYNASAIMFGEAKEGAVEVHNFSSSAFITMIHSKNVGNSRSVAMEKMLAKLVFSMATSKVTSGGSEEEMDKEDDSDNSDAVSATKPGVAIEGMQMLTRHHRNLSRDYMQEDNVSRDEEKDVWDIENEEAAQLTKNMNAATAKLNLLLLNGDMDTEDDDEADDVAINREGSPNPYSDDEGGKDFLKEDLSVHDKDLTLGDNYDTLSEVSSGVFAVTHSNQFNQPNNFKQLLWNIAGQSTGSMIILLDLLKDNLKADQAGLPTDFNRVPVKLLELMVQDAGKECKDQIGFIKHITEELKQISQTTSRNKAFCLEGGPSHSSDASKTQGMLPEAHEASPTEEATIEPALMAGQDEEGVQSLSMASFG
jgi:hypothetical protein